MTKYLHTNNAAAALRDSITSTMTTVRVASGFGPLFPNPGVDEAFFVTVEDRRVGRLEIMLCTARSSDTLTVVRGQQGTVPQSFAAGVSVANRLTAQVLNDFVAATVDVIPLARIPTIPDSKLDTVQSSRLTGTIATTRLPVIPANKLQEVPAEALTGVIPTAALPVIPVANLPVIPPSKLTSVPAESLTGDINPNRLPAIPASLLTSVPAANLTGLIASARLTGSYTNFINVSGSGNSGFLRFIADGNGGNAANPAFTFNGAISAGISYQTDSGVVISTSGLPRLTISGAKIESPTAPFTGSGAGLTNIPASALPTGSSGVTWAGARLAAVECGEIGSVALCKVDQTVQKNDRVAGNHLKITNGAGSVDGAAFGSGEVWRAHCSVSVANGVGNFVRVS